MFWKKVVRAFTKPFSVWQPQIVRSCSFATDPRFYNNNWWGISLELSATTNSLQYPR